MGFNTYTLSFRLFLSLSFFILLSNYAFATHNRAGEITVQQIGDLTLRATITTYTKTSSVAADKDSLEIFWGDGSSQMVARSNGGGQGVSLDNDIKFNTYIAEHTYPGRATYVLSMRDPNRNGSVLNLNNGSSDQIAFYVETIFTFLNPQFQGYNNSPQLLQPPIDVGYVGQPFIHNPNAFDAEGDSLAYELITPSMSQGVQATGYEDPDMVMPGPDNQISLNEITGDFLWDSPQQVGEYNIAILIKEYREGILISSIVRDMQIRILEGNNMPPEIETIEEICVIAGDIVQFTVTATDPDVPLQNVELTALGGPLQFQPSPATFDVPFGFQSQAVVGVFTWITPCEAISDQYYTVVFKAEDDFDTSQDTFGLSTLKTVRIKVVGPMPENLAAETGNGIVDLTWESPYGCENAEDDYFQGFSIWRRNSSLDVPLDTCNPGIFGYELIAIDLKDQADGNYVYTDINVERGRSYCYRVLAEFAQTSLGGNPYNRVQSLRSEEVCIQLSRDVPLITNVSVLTTDAATGTMEIRWSKPLADDLDTIQNPGPYTYRLLRAEGFTQTGLTPVPGATFVSNTYWEANDTLFTDTGLNTLDNPYSYQVEFFVNGEDEPLGNTNVASSVYLSIFSTDELNVLTWEEDVPWDNYEYHIFRENTITGVFDSIGLSTIQQYDDEGLINGEEYCYYVRSKGTYSIDGIIDPIWNLSQENCGTPLDSIPPCPTELMVDNICDTADNSTPAEAIENNLIWNNPNNLCSETDDVAQYNIYYAPDLISDFTIIETLTQADDTTLIHQPSFTSVAGCYAVTSIDSIGNESVFSNIVCVDNCPFYSLPNVFTPNGDGSNELFIPFPYRFIASIDLQIYDRWGGLVFETTDPDINWDGTNLKGEELAESTYFYVCKVFEQRVDGVVQTAGEPLSGFIHLIRGQ
jgi:gliding motility-associated-like protein